MKKTKKEKLTMGENKIRNFIIKLNNHMLYSIYTHTITNIDNIIWNNKKKIIVSR